MSEDNMPSPMPPERKRGVMLLNLGSPDSTSVPDVRRYLGEFLMDGRVLDAPAPIRAIIVNLFIKPFRSPKSAEAYKEIWTEEGAPLIASTYKLAKKLSEHISLPVAVGMRYGNPTTASAVMKLKGLGVEEVLVVPLYPHYAMSSYETALAWAQEQINALAPNMRVVVQQPFYDDPDYIDALASVARPMLEEETVDHVLFSYHGIPERHLRKSDPTDNHCLKAADCCGGVHPVHKLCYRHQVRVTSRLLANKLGLPEGRWSVSFQSRLGSDPWLQPYTDKTLERLPTEGVKNLAVICPAFVSDCLETIEEIDGEGREIFEDAGGKHFVYIPCLNESDAWVKVLARFVAEFEVMAPIANPA